MCIKGYILWEGAGKEMRYVYFNKGSPLASWEPDSIHPGYFRSGPLGSCPFPKVCPGLSVRKCVFIVRNIFLLFGFISERKPFLSINLDYLCTSNSFLGAEHCLGRKSWGRKKRKKNRSIGKYIALVPQLYMVWRREPTNMDKRHPCIMGWGDKSISTQDL